MAEIYADLVQAGERSLDGDNGIKKVPDKYINKVKEILHERSFITSLFIYKNKEEKR